MQIKFLLTFVAVIMLWLNTKASIAVLRDSLSEPLQRWLQFLMIWVFPLIGSLIVLGVHRHDENPSRTYRESNDEMDSIDDFDAANIGAGDAVGGDAAGGD